MRSFLQLLLLLSTSSSCLRNTMTNQEYGIPTPLHLHQRHSLSIRNRSSNTIRTSDKIEQYINVSNRGEFRDHLHLHFCSFSALQPLLLPLSISNHKHPLLDTSATRPPSRSSFSANTSGNESIYTTLRPHRLRDGRHLQISLLLRRPRRPCLESQVSLHFHSSFSVSRTR